MKLISNNLRKYMDLTGSISHRDLVIRINLAWYSHEDIEDILTLWQERGVDVFLDVPVGRQKPPHNKYTKEEIEELIRRYPCVKYLAVSNVETSDDLADWKSCGVELVPKIETINGIENQDLYEDTSIHYMMLDHGDLFLDIQANDKGADMYEDYINPFLQRCTDWGIKVLRERGLVFSDEE